MAACYFLHSFSGGAKSAEGPCEFDPPRQECTGKTSTGKTFACAAQRLGGGLNPKFRKARVEDVALKPEVLGRSFDLVSLPTLPNKCYSKPQNRDSVLGNRV